MSTLYDLICILPVSLLAVILFGGYAGIPQDSKPGYLLCIAVTAWFVTLRNLKKQTRLRSIGIVTVFLGVLELAAGKEARQVFAEEYFWVIWLVCFSAGSVLAGILMDKCIWLRRAAAAAMFLFCIIGTVLQYPVGKASFALICFFLLVCIAEEIQRNWQKSGCADRKEHITRIAPILLAGCFSVYLMPAPEQPYDWQFVKKLYADAVTGMHRLYGIVTHPSDDYATIGFSDKSGFLGKLRSSDEEVLYITTDNKTVREWKLTGCISSTFCGREWVFDTENSAFSRMFDTLETYGAVWKYDAANRPDYLQKTDLQCEARFYNTQYIFSPAKIKLGATRAKNAGFCEKNGSLISDKRFHYQDHYFISSFVLNYDNPHLADLLTDAAPLDEDEWKQATAAEGIFNQAEYSYEAYQKYRQDVYAQCCHSYGLSERASALVSRIQSSAANRYEAMEQLAAYLQTFSYSTDCGALPESVTDAGSFLDYFLFTSQQGYCMHFATAFVLMANEMGVPCRYVQGYNVSRDGSSGIIVRQYNAHAWPEAYFDNVGWVAFEPTPGYSTPIGWKTKEDHINMFDKEPTIPLPEDILPEIPVDPDEIVQPEEKISLLIFILPTLAVVSFLFLFYIISRSVSGRKYQKMHCAEKFRYLSQQNLRLLGYLGFRMTEEETLAEYQSRIMASDRKELCAYLDFIPLYETVLYSDKTVTDAEVASAENIYRALRALVGKGSLRTRLLLLFREQ